MNKVLLYGAGDGGNCVSRHLVGCDIVAYIDDKVDQKEKIPSLFKDKPVINPSFINNYEYDYIVISCIYGTEISKRLTRDYGVNRSKIIDFYHGEHRFFDMRIATLRLLSEQIYANKIAGNVAELGVYQGDFSIHIRDCFPDRKLYLLDTFEGFQEPDINIEQEFGYSNAKTMEFADTNIDMVVSKLGHGNYEFIKGRFPESLNGLEDCFVFVNLDVDLYEPIYQGLEYFYPRLMNGGFIMVHDYNSTMYSGVKSAVDKYCKENNVLLIPVADHCGSVLVAK